MVALDPRERSGGVGLVLQVERTVGGAEIETHPTLRAAEAGDTGEAGSEAALQPKLPGSVVIHDVRRGAVGVVVALVTDTGMEQDGGAQGEIVINPGRIGADDLVATRRDRIGETVLTVVLIGALARGVEGDLRVVVDVVVELDGRDVLNLAVRRTALKVVD